MKNLLLFLMMIVFGFVAGAQTIKTTNPTQCNSSDGLIEIINAKQVFVYNYRNEMISLSAKTNNLLAGNYRVIADKIDTLVMLGNSIIHKPEIKADTVVSEGEFITFSASNADSYIFYVNQYPVTNKRTISKYSTNSLKNGDYITVIGFKDGCATPSAPLKMEFTLE